MKREEEHRSKFKITFGKRKQIEPMEEDIREFNCKFEIEGKKMENYIVINGKKAELTEDQLIKLGIKVEDPEEKYPAKFKVGDRVKVSCSTRTLGRSEDYEGKTFTIKHVFKLAEYVNSPASNIRAYSIGKLYVVYENELESVSYEEMFERNLNTNYYFIDTFGSVLTDRETNHVVDFAKDYFSVGNYCKDEVIMKQRALHETLNRLLWQASIIAGELDNPWKAPTKHYYIYKDYRDDAYRVFYNDSDNAGLAYFPTERSAKDAIENIVKPFMKEHPEFVR